MEERKSHDNFLSKLFAFAVCWTFSTWSDHSQDREVVTGVRPSYDTINMIIDRIDHLACGSNSYVMPLSYLRVWTHTGHKLVSSTGDSWCISIENSGGEFLTGLVDKCLNHIFSWKVSREPQFKNMDISLSLQHYQARVICFSGSFLTSYIASLRGLKIIPAKHLELVLRNLCQFWF